MSYGSMTTTASDMVGQSFGPTMNHPLRFNPNDNPYPKTIAQTVNDFMLQRLHPQAYPAIIWRESMGDAMAKNPDSGAYGPAQIDEITAKQLGINRFDTYENIRGGGRYVDQLADKYKDLDHTLAAYNFGPGNFDAVNRDLSKTPIETMNYIKDIHHYLGY